MEPMARFGLTTCWLQISCSSQAELHWHDVRKDYGDLKCSQNYTIISNHFNNHQIWKISMKMKYVPPKKLKVLIALFFGSAGMGIFVGLEIATGVQSLYITLLGVINLCLGGFVAWILMTQKAKVRDSRKK